LTVTNLNDSGAGSLRAQIAAAAAGDSIIFAGGLTGTITLSSGELAINKNLSIFGPGATSVTVSGNNAQRVFHTLSGTNVSISGLTIANGTVSDFGAGVESEGSLTLSSCTVTGNSAAMGGGGVYFVVNNTGTASLTVSGDTFTSNTTGGNGGGLFSNVTDRSGRVSVSVFSSTFSNNSASGSGGAVDSSLALSLTANASFLGQALTMSSNQAGAGGGGFAGTVRAGDISRATETLFTITAQDSFAQNGGGFFSSITAANAGRVTAALSGITLLRDTATASGGGLFSSVTSTDAGQAALTVSGLSASRDTAATGGGATSQVTTTGSGSASATFTGVGSTGSTFSLNTATGAGGGLNSTVTNSGSGTAALTLTSVRADTNTAGAQGGGIFSEAISTGSGPAFNGSLFSPAGGAADATLNSVTVNGNDAGTDGGGVFADATSTGSGAAVTVVSSSTLTNNAAEGRSGPGILVGLGGGLRMTANAQGAGSAFGLFTSDTATGNTAHGFGAGGISTTAVDKGSGSAGLSFFGVTTNGNSGSRGGLSAEATSSSSGPASVSMFFMTSSGNSGSGMDVSVSSTGNGQASASLSGVTAADNSSNGINVTVSSSGTALASANVGFATVTNDATGLSASVGSTGGESDLTVNNSTFSGNNGGGVKVSGTTFAPTAVVSINMNALTVSDNTNSDFFSGGGITFNLFAGADGPDSTATGGTVKAALTASTVAENSGRFGGGIDAQETVRHAVPGQLRVLNAAATLTIANSTLFANHADFSGGGLDSNAVGTDGPVGTILVSDTLAFNDANQGGGIFAGGPITVRSTIVADDTAVTDADVFGAFTSLGHNLIGQTDGSTGWIASDLTGTSASPLDPMFGDFGNFGGPTQTLSLLSGSPAIGHGDPAGPATDQRGVTRSATAPSIGAFEFTG
jgi:predicted outer membrane repeat protein